MKGGRVHFFGPWRPVVVWKWLVQLEVALTLSVNCISRTSVAETCLWAAFQLSQYVCFRHSTEENISDRLILGTSLQLKLWGWSVFFILMVPPNHVIGFRSLTTVAPGTCNKFISVDLPFSLFWQCGRYRRMTVSGNGTVCLYRSSDLPHSVPCFSIE